MRDENGLMVLRAAREIRCNKSDAEAAALIAKEIGHAGSFVVFVFGQIRIGKLADGNEEDEQELRKAMQGSGSK